MVKLGDLIKIRKGTKIEPTEEGANSIRFIQIEDLRSNNNLKYCSPIKKYVIAKEEDLILAWDGANAGTVGYGIKGAIGSTLAVLRFEDKAKLNTKYIGEFLKSKFQYLRQNCTGATIPHINRKSLENIQIPLPPLEVQKHIADTLDKTQKIIDGHKKQLEELNNLIKATFYDMFGDPVTNEKRWEKRKLFDMCHKITDGTHDTPKRVSKGILFITGKNIKPFNIDLNNVEYVSEKDHEIIFRRCNPEYKDVLYTNIGVNYGTAAINHIEHEFSMKNVALLKYKRNILSGEYLQCYLNYKRDYIIRQNKTGGAQTFMGLNTIKQLEVLIPPLDLQTKFAEIVTNIEEQKAIVKQSIAESETLFNSLMSKYFE